MECVWEVGGVCQCVGGRDVGIRAAGFRLCTSGNCGECNQDSAVVKSLEKEDGVLLC